MRKREKKKSNNTRDKEQLHPTVHDRNSKITQIYNIKENRSTIAQKAVQTSYNRNMRKIEKNLIKRTKNI